MTDFFRIVAACICFLPVLVSHGESPQQTAKDLKAAEEKLDCCVRSATEFLKEWGAEDLASAFKESQSAWEKYRDLAVAFEFAQGRRDDAEGQQRYDQIVLTLTKERIETINRFFEYTLCSPTDVRIRNDSNVLFRNVVVAEQNYGDLKPGEATPYQRRAVAYRYTSVTLTADSKELKIRPIDFTGATPLGEGKFTYSLTVAGGNIEIKAVKDEKAEP